MTQTVAHPPEPRTTQAVGAPPWRKVRYSYIRPLGHGGFGDVYLAHDTVRGHVVALKVLRGIGDDPHHRLRREFRILKDFEHPGIVELFELHIDDDDSFFTMEFIRGEPITRTVDNAEPEVRYQRTRRLLRGLIEAVCTLHSAGIVHRDIKPSNVLVTPEGRLVLLDAGLARSVDGSSREYFAGTVAYMSPEQTQGQPTTPFWPSPTV